MSPTPTILDTSPVRVRIRRTALADMDAHARAALPNECCGLLVGAPAEIVRAVRTRNLRPSPTRYRVDPKDHFDAIRAARAEGRAVVGAYHSHPGAPPIPSTRDLAEANDRDCLYVIVSVGEAPGSSEVRAYRFTGETFEPVELEAID